MHALARTAAHALALAALTVGCASSPPATAGLRVGPIPQGVIAKTSVTEYDVPAADYRELLRELRARGPMSDNRRWAGVTNWRISWKYEYERQGAFCALRRVNVLVDSRVEVPRWTVPEGASRDTSIERRWTTFRESLLDHEAGHVRLALQGGGLVAKALEGLSAASCDALGLRANAIGQKELDDLRKRQAQYDGITRHGALQGTALEPDRRPPQAPR